MRCPLNFLFCHSLPAAETGFAYQLALGGLKTAWQQQLGQFFEGSTQHAMPWRIQVGDQAGVHGRRATRGLVGAQTSGSPAAWRPLLWMPVCRMLQWL